MPWKGEKDPYKIWVSEIILQQTRVGQGTRYYEKFIKKFPTIEMLATAKDEIVYKNWEGLGYYRRCSHLIETARYIYNELRGQFPATYNEIIKLKGVGPYTAAAISSFAFNEPRAVVDGNVYRVLARYFGINTPVDMPEGNAVFKALAQKLLDKKTPAEYNQAIMDFGAVICKPAKPACEFCPLNAKCFAYLHRQTEVFPVKLKKIKSFTRYFIYLEIQFQQKTYIVQRTEDDIWKNLYQFILIETDAPVPEQKIHHYKEVKEILKGTGFKIHYISRPYQQKLTHQIIIAQILKIEITNPITTLPQAKLMSEKAISKLAFPKVINDYLKEMYL